MRLERWKFHIFYRKNNKNIMKRKNDFQFWELFIQVSKGLTCILFLAGFCKRRSQSHSHRHQWVQTPGTGKLPRWATWLWVQNQPSVRKQRRWALEGGSGGCGYSSLRLQLLHGKSVFHDLQNVVCTGRSVRGGSDGTNLRFSIVQHVEGFCSQLQSSVRINSCQVNY